jgi:hypothetical protein
MMMAQGTVLAAFFNASGSFLLPQITISDHEAEFWVRQRRALLYFFIQMVVPLVHFR